MAESKHTPGPWTLGTGSQTGTGYAVCAGPQILATVNGFGYPLDIGHAPESDANAALIAAAPDMYEALQGALYYLTRANDESGIVPKIRAALARTEGREVDADNLAAL